MMQVAQAPRHRAHPLVYLLLGRHPRLVVDTAMAADVMLDVAALHVLGDKDDPRRLAALEARAQEGHEVDGARGRAQARELPDVRVELRLGGPALLQQLPLDR